MTGVDLPLLYSGKVREIYDAGDDRLLLVASDRMSAFDVVMEEPIPHKGAVLTAMSAYWFDALGDTVPNHLITTDMREHPSLQGRAMLVRRAEMLSIECIVRGYLSGSAWREYRAKGTMHGMDVPAGLQESAKLPEPVFTPSTKATSGHDENISYAEAVALVGEDTAARAEEMCLTMYTAAAESAASRGIILADTKFELGFVDGTLAVADEVLTPDSSRLWEAASWEPGTTPASFDKQPVRDYLDGLDWDKTYPPPPLPPEVVDQASERYVEAYERVTGLPFSEWTVAEEGT